MPSETLILAPFKQALDSLKVALQQPKNEFTRDASIQRFEYTFELSWKMLKRHLKNQAGVDEFNIKNLFREAAKMGLIEHAESWFTYLTARNLTSHTYNQKIADETYQVAQQFMPDAEKLFQKLANIYDNPTH